MLPAGGTLPQVGGSLQQAILAAQNEISRLLGLGLGENSLSVIKARQIFESAKQAAGAATGSQQGLNMPGGGGMFAFGLPAFTQEQGIGLSGGRPGGDLMNEGPLGQLLAQLLPAIFAGPQLQAQVQPQLQPQTSPGGRVPMPTAAQPVKFLPSGGAGSQPQPAKRPAPAFRAPPEAPRVPGQRGPSRPRDNRKY